MIKYVLWLLFKYGKSLGDELMVGLDDDGMIKRFKGNKRFQVETPCSKTQHSLNGCFCLVCV